MPGSLRRVGQGANQSHWWGVAASQGGESRNGGRGQGERGWGRSALRGVRQCGNLRGSPREQTLGGDGRPARLSLRATAWDQVSNKSLRAGGAVRRRARPGCPSRAAQGPAGVGAAPPSRYRQRPDERSAQGGVLLSTPQGECVLEIPLGTEEARESVRFRKCPNLIYLCNQLAVWPWASHLPVWASVSPFVKRRLCKQMYMSWILDVWDLG